MAKQRYRRLRWVRRSSRSLSRDEMAARRVVGLGNGDKQVLPHGEQEYRLSSMVKGE